MANPNRISMMNPPIIQRRDLGRGTGAGGTSSGVSSGISWGVSCFFGVRGGSGVINFALGAVSAGRASRNALANSAQVW